jgi:ABC-type amino acid transport substrate-binding protein
MQLKKLMIEVMVFFVLGCFLCACGKTKDQTRKTTKDANKEIMIGGDNYPPFNYTDENGNLAGIDVEFAREAFHRMGYKPVFVNIDWENKKNLVEQGKIDCIWACFSVTGRENDYHWAGPYMLSRQVIAVNDSSKINKPALVDFLSGFEYISNHCGSVYNQTRGIISKTNRSQNTKSKTSLQYGKQRIDLYFSEQRICRRYCST